MASRKRKHTRTDSASQVTVGSSLIQDVDHELGHKEHVAWLAALAAAGAYFLLMLWLYPFQDVFELNPDEGNRIIIAQMLERGYQLYSQIWNDQPPLLSYLTMWWCQICGWEVNNARILILLFAAGIIFATYDSVRLIHGHPAALAATALLPCTQYFMRLSVSAMVGLPAIAWATLCAWALLRWTLSRRIGWLVAAGILMALSLMTKAFTAFLLPVFGVWLLLIGFRQYRQPGRQWKALWPAALWSLCVISVSGTILLLTVTPSEFAQLHQGHLDATQAYPADASVEMLMGNICLDWEIAVLAGLGVIQIVLSRKWLLLPTLAWVIVGFAALRAHSPVWYHHHLLLSVPACLLAGTAVGDIFSSGWKPRLRWRILTRISIRLATAALAIILIVSLARGAKNEHTRIIPYQSECDRFAVEVMKSYQHETSTVVVDRQMYAVRAGFAVPPNLCVTSHKRMTTGNLLVEDVIKSIEEYEPEQIVLARTLYTHARTIMKALPGRYQLIYHQPAVVLIYLRSDISGDPLAILADLAEKMQNASAYDFIGVEWAKRGEAQKARIAFIRANEIDPTYPEACLHLADLYMAGGDYTRGFEILIAGRKKIDVQRYVTISRHYARRKATCPAESYRDGTDAEAVIDLVVRLQGAEFWEDLQIRAAALAAQGRFAPAIMAVEKALDLVNIGGRPRDSRRLRQQLEAYQQQKIWTEAIRLPTY